MNQWPLVVYASIGLMLVVAGCRSSSQSSADDGGTDSDTDSVTDSDGDTGSSTDTGPFECAATFDVDPIAWALPPKPESVVDPQVFNRFYGIGVECSDPLTVWSHIVMPLEEDGARELLVSGACDLGGAGTDHWLVHRNSGAGFTDEPEVLSLPNAPALAFEHEPFSGAIFDGSVPCADESTHFRYVFTQVDGDGPWDLLVTDYCDVGWTGEDHWLVYWGTEDGFSSPPTALSLPPAPPLADPYPYEPIDPFALTEWVKLPCEWEDDYYHHNQDLDGDGFVDIVVTDNCDSGGVGETHWQVHLGSGEGFANVPLDWPLPTGEQFGDDYFDEIYGSFMLWDMDADGLVDLVDARDDGPGGVGETHWEVYLNSGSGFPDSPIEWSLPEIYPEQAWFPGFPAAGLPCEGQGWRYTSAHDFTGDGRPDLVVTDACDSGGVGESHWLVHRNIGDGFAAIGEPWCLPPPVVEIANEEPFSATTSGGTCEEGSYFTWSVDLTDDGCLDLVVMDDCADDGVGLTHWLVYPGSCGE